MKNLVLILFLLVAVNMYSVQAQVSSNDLSKLSKKTTIKKPPHGDDGSGGRGGKK